MPQWFTQANEISDHIIHTSSSSLWRLSDADATTRLHVEVPNLGFGDRGSGLDFTSGLGLGERLDACLPLRFESGFGLGERLDARLTFGFESGLGLGERLDARLPLRVDSGLGLGERLLALTAVCMVLRLVSGAGLGERLEERLGEP